MDPEYVSVAAIVDFERGSGISGAARLVAKARAQAFNAVFFRRCIRNGGSEYGERCGGYRERFFEGSWWYSLMVKNTNAPHAR
jgi:hypothetical protein